MDFRNPFYNTLSPNSKLTKAASYSELSSSQKVIIEHKYESTCGNLTKQYSCEQIFDKSSNTSQLRVSQVVESNNEKHSNIWKTIVNKPGLNNSIWSQKACSTTNFPPLQQTEVSNQWLFPSKNSLNKSNHILAPPKLTFNNNDENNKTWNLKNQSDYNTCEKKKAQDSFQFKVPLPVSTASKINKNDEKNLLIKPLKSIPFNNTSKEKIDTSDLKKKLRSLVTTKEKNNSNMCHIILKFLFISLLGIAFCIIPFYSILQDMFSDLQKNGICNPMIVVNNIPEDLKNYVFGQDDAIQQLTDYFVKNDKKAVTDFIAFFGPIGVGKTFASEIIKSNLIDEVNVINFFPPLQRKIDLAETSLSFCKCNLIKLDNLKLEDMKDLAKFSIELKKRAKNFCILIMAMISHPVNIAASDDLHQSHKFLDEIFENFRGERSFGGLLKFDTLTENALIKCINDAANYADVELSNEALESVISDLKLAESGCKGAYSKVQIVGKPKKKIVLKSDL